MCYLYDWAIFGVVVTICSILLIGAVATAVKMLSK